MKVRTRIFVYLLSFYIILAAEQITVGVNGLLSGDRVFANVL